MEMAWMTWSRRAGSVSGCDGSDIDRMVAAAYVVVAVVVAAATSIRRR